MLHAPATVAVCVARMDHAPLNDVMTVPTPWIVHAPVNSPVAELMIDHAPLYPPVAPAATLQAPSCEAVC